MERLLVTRASDALVAETIHLRVDSGGNDAEDDLGRQAEQLLRALLAGDASEPASERPCGAACPESEILELCALPDAVQSAWLAAPQSLAAALAILADTCGRVVVSVRVASVPRRLGPGTASDAVSCQVRIVSRGAVPAAALAHVSALAGVRPETWIRGMAREPGASRPAAAPTTSILAAARLAAVPVSPQALRIRSGGRHRPSCPR
ncbi:hypothetical protein [Baekduia sp. Peel2402]|uniref:hypothetical protein n=1 Tax=Baekduia sp. Peel2402 TaxID=3458296 RepID=UPI00403E79ED